MKAFILTFLLALTNTPLTKSFTKVPSISYTKHGRVRSELSSTNTGSSIGSDSRKEALLSNAKDLSLTRESYAPSTWSNRYGSVLTPAAPSVYTADRPFYWNNIDVGGRMTIIQLTSTVVDPKDGKVKPKLWVHSPIELDATLQQALDELGVVTHVVSPNYEHVKYAQQWGEAFPDAFMWACPGMMEKEPQVRWTGEIPFGCRPVEFGVQEEWDERLWDPTEIEPCHFDVEVNPFTNKPFFNEVVFYHVHSKSVLMTDLFWNYPGKDGITNSNYKQLQQDIETKEVVTDFGSWELAPSVPSIPLGSRLWKVGMDKIYLPFYRNLMVRGAKDEYQRLASFITGLSPNGGWQVESLIPCHGDIVRDNNLIKAVLKQHFKLN